MRIGKKGIMRILLYGTAIILALILLSPTLINQLINSTALKRQISNEIERYSGVEIPPEDIEFILAPLPGIRFLNTEITLNPAVNILIKKTEITLDLIKLFDRQLAIDRIQINSPNITYTPQTGSLSDHKGELPKDLLNFSIPSRPVETLFALFPHSQEDLHIDVIQAKTDFFNGMDAQVQVSKDNHELHFQATVQDLNIEKSKLEHLPWFSQVPVNRISSPSMGISLTLDNSQTLSGKFNIRAPKFVSTEIKDKALTAEALEFTFRISEDKLQAYLLPSQFTYPKGRVGVNFSMDNAKKKSAITFFGEEVDISQAREVSLPILRGVHVSDQLFDILRGGTAKKISVGFKSPSFATLFGGENLIIDGIAESARVAIPGTRLTAHDVYADVTMKKGILHIEPEKGRISTTHIREGVLDIDLLKDDEVPFSGKFILHTRLKELPAQLISLLPQTELAREMARIKEIRGQAEGELRLLMAPGQKELQVMVTAKNIKAAGQYDRIPLPLKIDKGEFQYKENTVRITGFSGSLGSSPVSELTAEAELGQEARLNLKSGAAVLSLDELMPWADDYPGVMALLDPVQALTGTLDLDEIKITGPMFKPELWQFSASGSGEEISIGFQDHPGAMDSVSGRFEIGHDHISAVNIAAVIRNIDWLDHAAEEQTLSSIQMPLDVFESKIEQKSGQTYIHGKLTSPAGPLVAFDLSGDDFKKFFPTLVVVKDPEITDAMVFPSQNPNKAKLVFDGYFNTQTLEKFLIPGSPLHKKLLAFTAGEDISVSTDPLSNIHIKTGKLNLDALLPKGARLPENQVPATKKSRPLLSHRSLFFKAAELIYLDTTFRNVDTIVDFGDHRTKVKIRNADLCDLTGIGSIEILYGNEKPNVTSNLTIQAIDQENVANVLGCLFKTDSLIEGPYSFAAQLYGQENSDLVALRQNGQLEFKSLNGRIYKATLLSRVLSVINILGGTDLKQEGFAYKSLTIEADIKDSVVHLTKAFVDADNMAIIATGWLDLPNDELDMTFLVAPLKTIDTIIQKIPVVNSILSGRLVSFPARATGKISDPKVVPLAPSAVGKGILNLFKDLLNTPVRMMEAEQIR